MSAPFFSLDLSRYGKYWNHVSKISLVDPTVQGPNSYIKTTC